MIRSNATTTYIISTITTTTTTATTVTAHPTTYAIYRSPDYYFNTDRDYFYHLRTDVYIQRFHCTMIDKTMTGVPVFRVFLLGKVDPSLAGRQIVVWFNDSHVDVERASATIRSDGSFDVSTELALANTAVIPLREIRID